MARVTIVGLHYSPERSGNAPYTTSLARGLTAAGHRVHVVTGFPHYPEWKRHDGYTGWRRPEIREGVSIMRLQHYIPRKPTGLRRLVMELTFGFRAVMANWEHPDVIILVSPALLSTGLAAVRARLSRNRTPFLVWVQDLYSRGLVETNMATGPVASLALRLESAILGSADGIVAIHERFRTYIVNTLGVVTGEVRVIRNWTHLPTSPGDGQLEFRNKMGWHDDDIIVLHAGNMGKKQGLMNVVEAARLAEREGSSVRFVLMGDGNQRAGLESASAGLKNVSFVDSLPGPDFMTALTAADILLVNELPGVKDMSVPSKLTSYFNAGVPVLAATDSGSVTAEEVTAADSGLLVPADNPAALLNAAESMAADQDGLKRMGANGLQFRLNELSEEAAMATYNDFVTSLASSRSR